MTHISRLAAAAAVALIAGAGMARGQANSQPATPAYTEPGPQLQPNVYTPTSVERGPLMMGADEGGLGKSLDQAGLRLYGHAEASTTINTDSPPDLGRGAANFGRVFDIEDRELVFNQLTFNVERVLDLSKNQFDLGGRIELMYGEDARFIKSNGLLDGDDFFSGPEVQFDVVQAYLDVGVPLGKELRIRAGKFTYFKQLDPNASVFYSHSFSFGGALPFTLTGITGLYPVADKLGIEAGVVRGWDQSVNDNNNAVSFLGRVRYDLSDRTQLVVSGITGPEQDDNSRDYRSVVDVTVSHRMTDKLTLLADAVWGHGDNEIISLVGGTTTLPQEAVYYGVSGYAIYEINEYVSPAARLEWFRDQDGLATAADQTLFEATLGATVTPFPHDRWGRNIKIRPEIRYDYSDVRYFDGFSNHDQLTFAIDMIVNY